MLKLKNVRECFMPDSLQEAINILRDSQGKAAIVGGGLDITVFPRPYIEELVFLDKLHLNYIKEENDEIRIGATVTITDMEKSLVIKNYLEGKVGEILGEVASQLLRNQITIGGSIARGHFYSDIIPIVYALRGKIVLSDGKDNEEILVDDFYNGNFRELLKNKIITEVRLKRYDDTYRFGMRRFVRNATDIPLLNAAMLVKVEGNIIQDASISLASRPANAYRFVRGEEFLKGKKISEELAEDLQKFTEEDVDVSGDSRLSKTYRKHLAGVYLKNILLSFEGGTE